MKQKDRQQRLVAPAAMRLLRVALTAMSVRPIDLAAYLSNFGEPDGFGTLIPRSLTGSAVSRWLAGDDPIPTLRLAQINVFLEGSTFFRKLDVEKNSLEEERHQELLLVEITHLCVKELRKLPGVQQIEGKLTKAVMQGLMSDPEARKNLLAEMGAPSPASYKAAFSAQDPERKYAKGQATAP